MRDEEMTLLEGVLDAAAAAELRVRSYSGRGMYGETCLGIVTDNVAKTLLTLASCLPDGMLADLAEETVCTDSMGRNAIVYWPNLPYKGDDEG